MLNFFLILLNILLYTMQTLFFKMYADRYPGRSQYASFVYLVMGGGFAAFVSIAVSGFDFEFNYLTLILAALAATSFFMYYFTLNIASANGPYSIVMLFSVVGGMCFPILTSLIAFGDAPSIWQVLCYLVVFTSSWFVIKKPNETTSVKNKKVFFTAVIGVAISNGMFSGFINLQQVYTGQTQNDEMLMFSYLISAVFSFSFIFIKNKKDAPKIFRQTKGSILFMVLAALVAASAVNMLVFISAFIDVNLLWTFNNSGVLVFSVIASAIIFKEKLTKSNMVACAIIAVMLAVISVV